MDGPDILIVDDDPQLLEMLAVALRSKGHTTAQAQNGDEALRLLAADSPRLIIADVMMPGMDGYELCRRVRASGKDWIPFIFCSAKGSLPERIAGLKLGADDYIAKPFSTEELALKVSRMISWSRRLEPVRRSLELPGDGGQDAVLTAPAAIMMQGSIADINLANLLQIVTFSGLGNLRIMVTANGDDIGELYIEQNQVVHAATRGMAGYKALFRLLALQQGTFRTEKASQPPERTISFNIGESLLTVLTQLDEYQHLRSELSEQGHFLSTTDAPQDQAADPESIAMLDLIARYRNLDAVLDQSPRPDLDTIRLIFKLVKTGAVLASKN